MPVMLLTSIPLVGRIVALPFLTILTPSEKRQKELKQKYQSLQKRAIQVVYLLRRWFHPFNFDLLSMQDTHPSNSQNSAFDREFL
jgi:hypothetical protein